MFAAALFFNLTTRWHWCLAVFTQQSWLPVTDEFFGWTELKPEENYGHNFHSFEKSDEKILKVCSESTWELVSVGLVRARVINGFVSNSGTVETLYSTIYYSKYSIELNFDKSSQYVVLWTHKRHSIPRPFGRAMECLLWVLQQKLTVL